MRTFLFSLLSILTLSVVLNASGDMPEVNTYIVKTQDLEVLTNFAEANGLELGPFLTYPNPSQDALDRFSCYHMITIPESLRPEKAELIAELEVLPGIVWVEPNLPGMPAINYSTISVETPTMPDTIEPHVPNDPWFGEQYGPRITHVDVAWTASTGEGTVIAVIGSGVDTDHEDLVSNLDLDRAWDFDSNDNDVEDDIDVYRGHETAVIGIAGAKIDNAKGIAGTAGDCSILPLQAVAPQSISNAVIYAADQGVDVVSISWSFTEDQAIADAVEYAWGKGVFICAGAGNSDSENIYAPASIEHVMSIGGTDSRDQRWVGSERASNFGPGVDIYAPADSIFTTRVDGDYGYMYFIDPIEEDTVLAPSGTSYATPLIAGIAALIKDVYPTYTNQDIWDRLLETADTITIDKGDVLRVNAAKAVGVGYEDIAEPVTPPEVHHSNWEVLNHVGSEIVLRYTDRPQGFSAAIYDASGQKVDELHSNLRNGAIEWGSGFPSGVYFIMEEAVDTESRKVVLVK